MGRVLTPKYAVEVEVTGPYRMTPFAWRPEYGRANAENLTKFVEKLEDSSQPGMPNAHLGQVNVTRATLKLNVAGGAAIAIVSGSRRWERA